MSGRGRHPDDPGDERGLTAVFQLDDEEVRRLADVLDGEPPSMPDLRQALADIGRRERKVPTLRWADATNDDESDGTT